MRFSRVRMLPLLLAIACDPDPAEITVSLPEPATASAQYFHGNCLAGFSVGVALRIQETRSVGFVVTRMSFRMTDQGSGQVAAEEVFDQEAFDSRFGDRASVIPSNGTRTVRLSGVLSIQPEGPILVNGEIEAIDENDQRIIEPFQLSAPLVVDNPPPPGGGACGP